MIPSLLLLLLCLCFQAHAATVITHLPGFSGPLPFYLETGYVGVDEMDDVQLFYYFIESEGNPREDPVLLWLTGGPGCSALSGLAFEVGPLNFRKEKYNGTLPSLVYNPYSWTKVSSVIFLDSPVGTGFSYSKQSETNEVGDITFSQHVHTFLLKWFNDHPQFLANHLYIAGDSYAGKIIPVIAEEISEGTKSGNLTSLNLKGYLIGNPVTGEKIDDDSLVPFLHGVGIISDELYEATIRSCGKDLQSTNDAKCANVLNVVYESYAYLLSYYWANNNITREALHIDKGSVREWQRCNYRAYTFDIPSSLKYHLNLTRKGYRALVYSGDHDAVIPFLGTQAWIRSLNFSIVDDWRSWRVSGQVAGYTKTYANNMTFATVKGAGHTAPEYRPKECLAMLRRWISHQPL